MKRSSKDNIMPSMTSKIGAALFRNRFLLLALGCFALGLILRKIMPKPYVWVFAYLALAAGFGFLTAFVRSNAARYVMLSLMSVFFALFAAEAWLSRDAPGESTRYKDGDISEIREKRGQADLIPYQSNIEKDDPVLGARPRAQATRSGSRVYRNGKMLYDVVYSTLESGWRVTPQHPEADKAVVFFGCSFTFGQGLEDEQSIPYRVAELLGPEYQVFNFALYGYGAHQMLAQIEHGFLDDIVGRYKEVQAFFLTIDGHELRCSGFEDWVKSGPLYADENGRAVYKGDIRDMERPALPPLRKFMRNCLIYRRLAGSAPPHLEEYRQLHAAIIAESARGLKEKNVPLTVLLWPDAPFEEHLRRRGLEPVFLGPALPGWQDGLQRYVIPDDGHPNALGADLTARFIAGLVVSRHLGQTAPLPETE